MSQPSVLYAGAVDIPLAEGYAMVNSITSINSRNSFRYSFNSFESIYVGTNPTTTIGAVYVPELTGVNSTACGQGSVSDEITRLDDIPKGMPRIAIAPLTSEDCGKMWINQSLFDGSEMVILYNQTNSPLASMTNLFDPYNSTLYHSIPSVGIFVLPYLDAVPLLFQMESYSGALNTIPNYQSLQSSLVPNSVVRVGIQAQYGNTSNSAPSTEAWVYVLIIAAIIVVVAFVGTACLRFSRIRQSRDLRRRILSGDVEIQSIGLQNVRVPRSMLDLLPLKCYHYSADEVFGHSEQVDKPDGKDKNRLHPSLILPNISFKEKFHHLLERMHVLPRPLSTEGILETTVSTGDQIQSLSSLSTRHLDSARSQSEDGGSSTKAFGATAAATTISREASTDTTRPIEYFSQTSCPICLDEYIEDQTTVRELPCRHIYHPGCIDPYLLERSSQCPLCKVSVLTDDDVKKNIRLNNSAVWHEMERQRENMERSSHHWVLTPHLFSLMTNRRNGNSDNNNNNNHVNNAGGQQHTREDTIVEMSSLSPGSSGAAEQTQSPRQQQDVEDLERGTVTN